ncbi:hypothetical protein ABPG75_002640 [Micractinium tetrahymenae]
MTRPHLLSNYQGFMCLCLPCLGAGAVGAYKVNKAVDKAFSSKTPEEPVEPAFVTEAKLRWNLTNWKPSEAPQQEAARPKRSARHSAKEQQSKQRLAELVDVHKARSSKQLASAAPRQQTLRR